MRSQRKKQIMTLSILVVAILVISVGFAAFSSTLRINSEASVNPDSSAFGVKFSSNSTTLETNDVKAVATGNSSGADAIIVNVGNPTITNLTANFTKPGETVTYNFYVRNVGKYLAHLTSIVFDNADGALSNKQCTALETTTPELVQAACNGISVKLEVDGITVTGTELGITGSTLAINESKEVNVTISYDLSAARADGPFSIDFGSIYLTYGTVETDEMPILPALAYETWDGVSATALDQLQKDDSAKTVSINSAADLAGVRNAINSGELIGYNITLNKSIDLGGHIWEPIGVAKSYSEYTYGDAYFTGTFNGNGNTIKGLNVSKPGGQGTAYASGFFGGVVGEVLIENLILQGTVTSNGITAGGLIGFAKDYNETVTNLTVKNCVIDVAVTSDDAVSGVVGSVKTTGTVTLEGVKTRGFLTSTATSEPITDINSDKSMIIGKVGGLIGFNFGDNTVVITDCQNDGTLSNGNFVGGAIAYMSKGDVTITKFVNNGEITSHAFAGGVTGYVNTSGTVAIDSSINNANITATGNDSTYGVGGLVGLMNRPLTITNSTNNGNISSTANYVGGIIGIVQTGFTVDNCTNTGTVHATVYAGGIIGWASMNGALDPNAELYVNLTNNNGGTKAITSNSGTVGRIIGCYEGSPTLNKVISGNTGSTDIPLFGSGSISQ